MSLILGRSGRRALLGWLVALVAVPWFMTAPAAAFTLFESGQVRPLAMSPDGTRLFAVNTPDNRLEIFSVSGSGLTHLSSVEVGLEPVAVAARSNSEVWVVNHLSDSVSIVDVASARVTRTLLVGDEPRDIVFAGSSALGAGAGQRAFITTARRGQNTTVPALLTTEGTPRALVFVFDAVALASDTSLAGTPLTVVQLFGDTPRALATNPSGSRVYAAVFHSGNQTTPISEGAVCDDTNLNDNTVAGPCTIAGQSIPGGLPLPEKIGGVVRPETGIIVKYNNANNNWEDQQAPPRVWNSVVRFDLPDYDVFTIDADAGPPAQLGADSVQHAHVGTVLFNMIVNPLNNKVYVSNTDARNEVRFEGEVVPPFATVRSRLHQARITVLDGANVNPRHLNKHLDYSDVVAPTADRDASLATPMGMALSGTTLYVAAFGSQKIGVFDTVKLENDTFDPDTQDGETHIPLSGGGPSGVVLDGANNRLYVLTRFDNSISVVNTLTNNEVVSLKQPLYNPEPASIVDGRPFLYDAVISSSNGEASCSSCHIFGDFDSLSWDLGDPNGSVLNNLNPVLLNLGQDPDFHPLKGPMATQSLRGMANHGPMHWRGDRTGGLDEPSVQPNGGAYDEDLAFKKFNGAFPGLLGRDGELTAPEMQAFTDFILQVTYPPNPIRPLDNVLVGAAAAGNNIYFNVESDTFTCNGCHVLDEAQGFFGSDGGTSFEAEPQMFKVAHLRNMYQKVGMFGMPTVPFFLKPGTAHLGPQVRGVGFLHDGSVDTTERFHSAFVFDPPGGGFGFTLLERQQLEAFMMEFDSNLRPIVGQQVTITPANAGVGAVQTRATLLEARDAANDCEAVVKGIVDGERRGYHRLPGGTYQSDRAGETPIAAATLRLEAQTAGQELTYTCVPNGSGERIGVDRDEDGCFDRDEIDGGSDPANPLSNACLAGAAPMTTKKLLIKNKVPDDESKNKIVVLSKDPNISTPAPLSAGDPRCNSDPSGTVKASITISSASSTHTHTSPLPCQNWSLLGSASNPKGYKYGDSELNDGTAKKVKWQNGKQLKAILQGKGSTTLDYDLVVGTNEGQVAVSFTSTSGGVCLSCTGATKNGSDGKTFLGKDCPAPVSCP